MKKNTFRLLLAFILVLNLGVAQNLKSLDVDVKFYQKIKMSDGIKLSSNVYIPVDSKEKHPVILIITPYISDENHSRGLFFARNGYVLITVDSRGRGNSEGEFIPFENDGKDGYDIVNWISKQPWCDGNIGMLGGSYRGMTQWLTLKHFPKNLKTIIPIASVGPGRDFPKYNNIFSSYSLRWLMFTSGKTYNGNLFAQDFWKVKQEKLYTSGIPFNKYDSIVGFHNKIFQKWLEHPTHDTYWKNFYLTPKENYRINIPILSITGHFDGDQMGTLLYYKSHMEYGNTNAKKNHYLLIGPWSHGGTRNPKNELGGLKFGKNAVINMNQLYLDWFDWTLKGGKEPAQLKNRVMYYEMGSNQWKHAADINSISNGEMVLYLSSLHSNAKDVFFSGDLAEEPSDDDLEPDSITYNPFLREGINNPSYKDNSDNNYTSQGYINDGNILIYASIPFEENTTVNGKIKLEAYISMNVEDTDLRFTAYEITSENKSIFLQEDFLRAKYRNSLEKAEKVSKDKIVRYTLEGRNMFSRIIKKGSRIRLVFSTVDSPNYQKNYNYWKDSAYQSNEHSQKAQLKLYHNTKYPSRVILPIYIEDDGVK
ncbi:CocE/NonD family hydrolase [Aquimarina algiphila]|uniref:CocE/NonD family hydrolase n=1 Tax=Aquimarina algiphila TaxID=2047982 RepID=UPI00248FBC02|nr:CocE/NonD family hydrolase [Aquimarina algiphila]